MSIEKVLSYFELITKFVNSYQYGESILYATAGFLVALILIIRLLSRTSHDDEKLSQAQPTTVAADLKQTTLINEDRSSSKATVALKEELKDTQLNKLQSTQLLSAEQASSVVSEDISEVDQPEPLTQRLGKTRKGFFSKLKSIFVTETLTPETVEELQALLIASDIGVDVTQKLIASVNEKIASGVELNKNELLQLLKTELSTGLLDEDTEALAGSIRQPSQGPAVVMIVGVNGVGKTTTIAKLAHRWSNQGKKLMLVAGDTFRAAAVEQLCHWGEEIGVDVVSGAENAKPAAVVFEALDRAVNESVDILIIDTAGRLHNKSNLMQELEGVRNVLKKKNADAPHETWLVLDGSTGQNAVMQAREFDKAVNLTGVVVTKLDGTAKGGIVTAIRSELGIPIRFIGVGESRVNLRVFNANDFVEALFSDQGLDLDQASSSDTSLAEGEPRRRRRRRRADAV